ncbi:MAG: hypothetical protein ACRBF0_12120 [Calditrichia bacterium]
MPTSPDALLERMHIISTTVANSGNGLAVIGLGSVGIETERMDEYSDLDFFVIVKDGFRDFFLNDLNWMQTPCPLVWYFMNTVDGYKALYEDGIFCEMAVFEANQLHQIPFAPGRVIWKAADVDDNIAAPARGKAGPPPATTEWVLGEALSNLYVGMCRYHRGEKISALRFIQSYAVDRVLDLVDRLNPTDNHYPDAFDMNRRFEKRFPQIIEQLPNFLTGYSEIPESAMAILAFLDKHFEVNEAIRMEIDGMCKQAFHNRA